MLRTINGLHKSAILNGVSTEHPIVQLPISQGYIEDVRPIVMFYVTVLSELDSVGAHLCRL